jgi:hypothetical protein
MALYKSDLPPRTGPDIMLVDGLARGSKWLEKPLVDETLIKGDST